MSPAFRWLVRNRYRVALALAFGLAVAVLPQMVPPAAPPPESGVGGVIHERRAPTDPTPPLLEVREPAMHARMNKDSLVAGRTSPRSRVEVRVGAGDFTVITEDSEGAWSHRADVAPGDTSITVRATDDHGGTTEVSVPITTEDGPEQLAGAPAKPAVGPAANPHPLPSSPVPVSPGQDLQRLVSSNPGGTAFVLRSGVHRMQEVRPKDGNQFIGEPGAVLNGSRLLTSFTREGSYWVASGQRGLGHDPQAECLAGWSCRHRDELFINDQMLQQVTSLSQVGPGRWFFDYATGKVYFADDPAGKKVEITAAGMAIHGSGRNVTIRGLVVEKYGNPVHWGAVGIGGHGWTIEYSEFRLNHAAGISTGYNGPGHTIRHNLVHRNGQIGIAGQGSNVRVENNEITRNNIAGFRWQWEAGGTKFVRTDNLVVRGNYSHNNNGPGLWTDIDNRGALYERNLVEDNDGPGIFHEISYAAVIRGNHAYRNGFGSMGGGILVSCSPDVEVTGNTVKDNQGGIMGITDSRCDTWPLSNLRVHSNTVEHTTGYSGVGHWGGSSDPHAAAAGNRFDRNTYRLRSEAHHRWAGRQLDPSGWRSHGHDQGGAWH